MGNEPTVTPQPKKWYQQTGGVIALLKTAGVIALLILFFPVGLYLMWKYRVFSKTVRFVVTGFFALLVIASLEREKKTEITSPPSSSTTTSPAPTSEQPKSQTIETPAPKEEIVPTPIEPQIIIPEKQQKFTEAINSAKSEYIAAPNELKKSAVRTKRGRLIQNILAGSRRIVNWVGKIKRMETNSEGKAILAIELEGTNIIVTTWNNALSDLMDETLISQESNVFSTVSEMNKGDRVVFSGTFLASPKNDYITEGSLTERSSMLDPEFIFKFESIRKY
jgi:hypothetical protein